MTRMTAPTLDRVITVTIGRGDDAVEHKVWAMRRDPRLTDELDQGTFFSEFLDASTFTVRFEEKAKFPRGRQFTDDEGVNWWVWGSAELGRGRFLELFVRDFEPR